MSQIESFFWGIIAALGALFLEILLFLGINMVGNFQDPITIAAFLSIPIYLAFSAIIEESLKYLVISRRIEMLSLEKSFITNSLFVGIGFFLTELAMLTFGNMPKLSPIAEIAIVHTGTAGLIGYMVALKSKRNFFGAAIIVLFVSLIHFGYNFLVQERGQIQNFLIVFILSALVVANIVNIARIGKIMRS